MLRLLGERRLNVGLTTGNEDPSEVLIEGGISDAELAG